MPLRDLIVNTSELAERQIESIVGQYANYDVENERVVLLPGAGRLTVGMKILVYLVALRGWPFVIHGKEVATSARPARIGEDLNIRGGTLRPALKELKDSNYVSANGRAYSVELAALPTIENEIRRHTQGRTSAQVGDSGKLETTGVSAKKRLSKKSGRGSSGGSRGNTELFYREVSSGFFDEQRTLADVVNRFHEKGRLVHKGVVSPLLLNAVKREKLRRHKAKVNGKEVWVYESVK